MKYLGTVYHPCNFEARWYGAEIYERQDGEIVAGSLIPKYLNQHHEVEELREEAVNLFLNREINHGHTAQKYS